MLKFCSLFHFIIHLVYMNKIIMIIVYLYIHRGKRINDFEHLRRGKNIMNGYNQSNAVTDLVEDKVKVEL
jgi:hypothetical protein